MPKLFTVGSIVTHTVVVGSVIAVQALAVGPLPTPRIPLTFEGAIPVRIADIPLPSPPPHRGGPSPSAASVPNVAPVVAPPAIGEESGLESIRDGAVEPGADHSGGGGNGDGSSGIAERLVADQPPQAPAPVAPLRVGGSVTPPRKLVDVRPVYPRLAQGAHVAGIVILEATIDTRGRVDDVRVLRSISLLDQAAIDAVRQWVFAPTLLNGVPVPVVMTVTVNFTLQDR